MKFSFSNKNEVEQKLSITIPAKEIESEVTSKLNSAKKSAKIKGFRKGKAPLDVVTKIYEPEIRREVINDAVSKNFFDQVEEKGLKLVGRPNLTPETLDKDKDIKFKATFEVYPEVKLNNLSKLSYTKIISYVGVNDINKTIENIQKKTCSWHPINETSSQGDRLKIDYIGTMDGKEFEGGSANDFVVEIGSKSMIEGFEDGLIGLKKDNKKVLELNFPDDYGKSNLASKEVNFKIEVKEVLRSVLPDLNEDFFRTIGVKAKNTKEFRKEVKEQLEEDLIVLLKNKSKSSILDSLREANSFEVPKAMVESELNNMKVDVARRMGVDPKDVKEDLFPKETFEEEALKRVTVGVLLNKIIEEKEIKADGERVKQIVEERAAMYKEPQQVVNWIYSNEEQLRNIESISIEEQVVDILLSKAKPIEKELTYEECVSGVN
tara:strand:+ start:3765 stop:5069 length:1305 start_codon:yes stop_codon:yes gene_type:complete